MNKEIARNPFLEISILLLFKVRRLDTLVIMYAQKHVEQKAVALAVNYLKSIVAERETPLTPDSLGVIAN